MMSNLGCGYYREEGEMLLPLMLLSSLPWYFVIPMLGWLLEHIQMVICFLRNVYNITGPDKSYLKLHSTVCRLGGRWSVSFSMVYILGNDIGMFSRAGSLFF